MTYREIVYQVLDLLKLSSDDSYYSEEHIIFLVSKIRSAILKQTYANIKKEIPESNYQTICLDLEQVDGIDGTPCDETYLKSIQKIPTTLSVGNTSLYPMDFYQGEITYVSRERMRYVGHNKWLQNIIYASLGPNQYLYLKSNNPQAMYLSKVAMTGIFENTEEAAELSCEDEKGETPCDILDKDFPLEEGLVTTLIQMAAQFLTGASYRPKDSANDAADDLSELATFLRQNLKNKLQKQIEE